MQIAPLQLGPGNRIGYKANCFIREIEDLGNGFFYIDYTKNRTGKSHAYRQAVVRAEQRDYGHQDWFWHPVIEAKNSAHDQTNIYSWKYGPAPNYDRDSKFDVNLRRSETAKIKQAVLFGWELLWL